MTDGKNFYNKERYVSGMFKIKIEPSFFAFELMSYDTQILLHGQRTAKYAVALADNCPQLFEKYTQAGKREVLQAICDAGCLHDLGKEMFSRGLLYSEGKLSASEKKVMEQHPVRTVELLEYEKGFMSHSPIYQSIVKNGCLYHHEKWDGLGYPFGLCEGNITLEARIISAADILDALTDNRAYKQAWSFVDAFAYLKEKFGAEKDEEMIKLLVRTHAELEDTYKSIRKSKTRYNSEKRWEKNKSAEVLHV